MHETLFSNPCRGLEAVSVGDRLGKLEEEWLRESLEEDSDVFI